VFKKTLLVVTYYDHIIPPPAGGLPFDHSTIISKLRAQFDLGNPLTPSDAVAPK
jgi:hypothetical protein|tara:strand:+ start:404 stop:565 length:162 start_codon:yes stop_codon:yes gene_type:complete